MDSVIMRMCYTLKCDFIFLMHYSILLILLKLNCYWLLTITITMVNDTLRMMQTNHANAERILTQMKEGEVFELGGKTFTKWAGLVVAPDMEAVEWMKANVDAEFFNKYVVRIMDASPERFTMKIKY